MVYYGFRDPIPSSRTLLLAAGAAVEMSHCARDNDTQEDLIQVTDIDTKMTTYTLMSSRPCLSTVGIDKNRLNFKNLLII